MRETSIQEVKCKTVNELQYLCRGLHDWVMVRDYITNREFYEKMILPGVMRYVFH